VVPAKEQVKRLADRLTDEYAVLVLPLIRTLARRSRKEERETEDRQDVEDTRKALGCLTCLEGHRILGRGG
jgi:hypothetical protein